MAPFPLPQGKPWHPNTPNKQKLRQTHERTLHTERAQRGVRAKKTRGLQVSRGALVFSASGRRGGALLSSRPGRTTWTTAAPDDLSGWLQPLFLWGSYRHSERRWALPESEILPCWGGWLAAFSAEAARLGRTVGTSGVF